MTRPPPGVSFAQFFPNAPKVRAEAQGRADRDRSRRNSIQSSDSLRESAPGAPNGDTTGFARPGQSIITSDGPSSQLDDHDPPLGDIPSTVGSASSHTSSASSVFSHSQRPITTATSSHQSAGATPNARRDTSSFSPAPISKPDMPVSMATDQGSKRRPLTSSLNDGQNTTNSSSVDAIVERLPARDPLPSVKGMKCTYDPILDRVRNKSISKSAKPTYTEFGLVRIIIHRRRR